MRAAIESAKCMGDGGGRQMREHPKDKSIIVCVCVCVVSVCGGGTFLYLFI